MKKIILENTIFLYFRMILTSLVTFYTVRVVLNNLGTIDYGINNVVSSFITSFTLISNSIASSTQRFFSFELGKKESSDFNKLFNINIIIYFILGVFVVLLFETFGLWFLNNKLTIPANRLRSSNIIFQIYIVSFFFTILSIPYNSALIAYEKMKIYAYVSIIDSVMKLIIAILLIYSTNDKLIFYVLLSMIERLVILLIYKIYSEKKLQGCNIKFYWNKSLFINQFRFATWNMIGGASYILNNQGQNILLNIFFGPTINASKAISDKISSIIFSFSMNFYVAIIPQLIKSYAKGEKEDMIELGFKSSKFSYYLLFLLSLPIYFSIDDLLFLWLGNINYLTSLFTKLSIIYVLINVLEQPISQMIKANGDIKDYQIYIGVFTLLLIPISYFLFKLGFSSKSTLIVMIIIAFFVHPFRLFFLKLKIGISYLKYFKEVLIPILIVSVTSYFLVYVFNFKISNMYYRIFYLFSISFLITLSIIYFLGLNYEEKSIFKLYVKKVFNKIFIKE